MIEWELYATRPHSLACNYLQKSKERHANKEETYTKPSFSAFATAPVRVFTSSFS